MRIAIVGAGITGLTAGYRLSQRGHKVVVLEKENFVGGLAAGFRKGDWDWSLENYFHHFFTSDHALQNLAAELGLADKLFFSRPKSSIYYNGEVNQLDSPLSVLKFPPLSFPDRLRTGLVTAYLKSTNNWSARGGWRNLEGVTAAEWLKKFYGKKSYKTLWQPLLKSKFGKYASGVSMAWFWARIKKRSTKLGYIEGGFQVLIDKLVEEIEAGGGKVILNQEINCYNDIYQCSNSKPNKVIFTTPIESKKHKWVGALNLILILKEKFLTDGTYWLNINEPNFPFVAVVEHTNFISPKHYGGKHLLYVGGYYPQDHRYFKAGGENLVQEFLPYLKRINPTFSKFSIFNFQFSKNLYAQPVIPINYSKIIPSFRTSDPRVFRANMQMVYPWDRGVNYAIELGEGVANVVVE